MFGGPVTGSTISNITTDVDLVFAGKPWFGRCSGASFIGRPDGRTDWDVIEGRLPVRRRQAHRRTSEWRAMSMTTIRRAIRCHFTPCSTTVGPDGWLELDVDGATVEYAPGEVAPPLLAEYGAALGVVIVID